jgi:hypothetical protein
MGLTDVTVRLMLIFFPGIICFFIVDAFTVHRERKAHEILLLSYLYGMLCYFVCALILMPVKLMLAFGRGGSNLHPWDLSIFNWLSDSKAQLDFWEIVAATVVSFVMAFGLSYCQRKKLLHAAGQSMNVTKKFAEPDVWNFAFNLDESRWCVVRDMSNNLMFQWYIRAFSDVGDHAELLLTQVCVYEEKTSELRYEADRIYLARKKEDLTIEFHDVPQGEGASHVRQDDKAIIDASAGHSSVAGRDGSEGEPESGQHEHLAATQAGGERPSEQCQ